MELETSKDCVPVTGSKVAMKFFTIRPPSLARTAAARAFWDASGSSNRTYPDSSPILKSMNFTREKIIGECQNNIGKKTMNLGNNEGISRSQETATGRQTNLFP